MYVLSESYSLIAKLAVIPGSEEDRTSTDNICDCLGALLMQMPEVSKLLCSVALELFHPFDANTGMFFVIFFKFSYSASVVPARNFDTSSLIRNY